MKLFIEENIDRSGRGQKKISRSQNNISKIKDQYLDMIKNIEVYRKFTSLEVAAIFNTLIMLDL